MFTFNNFAQTPWFPKHGQQPHGRRDRGCGRGRGRGAKGLISHQNTQKSALFNECRFFFSPFSGQKSLGTKKYRAIGDKMGTNLFARPHWGQKLGTSGDKIWSVFSPKNHRVEGDEKAYEARLNTLFSTSFPPSSMTSVTCWYTLSVTSARLCPSLVWTYFSGAPAAIIIEQCV